MTATKRWSMLAISLIATLSANVFINAIAFLIPAMNAQRGIGLASAGLLASMPNFGTMVTLIGWGYLLDVIGERFVLATGLALTAGASWAAAHAHSMVLMGVFLFLGGMAAASTITASGRLVTGWFPPHQRALAMGIRQTAQPLGIGVGAVVLPALAKHDFSAALIFPAVACAVSAVGALVGVRDPARPPRAEADRTELANPYRETGALWRIHLASALLMLPQPVVLTFMLVWATRDHGFSIAWAGALMGFSQLLGALARTAAGRWADRIGSRMRPLRKICVVTALVLFVLAVTDQIKSPIALGAMVVALAITGDNGLPFTTVPEIAGRYWSGRALGTQNTVERLVVAIAPPVFGAFITAAGYPVVFAVCGLFPLAALPFLPMVDRRPQCEPARL
ncbi:MFS transporter [Candidatus Mycobacterium wuenschmannii]|uniref:MFS transporter n=1 Tax=Candidatus Mycobacterium wuenschmannii TaxID=3027808 RepID=A0ABY8VYP9_9MYCO|nr:MFS transporter [Candidatus Mycobacterium wuenschmannii]WIM87278.1 MFS transporter [Candidatus Mycobacterium wuenschmannii]